MYDELLKFAVQLAKAAGGIQLAYFRGDKIGRASCRERVFPLV